MGNKLVKKISSKVVVGDVKLMAAQMLVANEKSRDLYTVIGVGRAVEGRETDYGIAEKFKGNFLAVNLLTGEEFRSGACFLPGPAGQMLSGAMAGEPIEFGFKIGIELDASSATGYVYTTESLITPAENDPLTLLAKSIAAPLAIENQQKTISKEATPEVARFKAKK